MVSNACACAFANLMGYDVITIIVNCRIFEWAEKNESFVVCASVRRAPAPRHEPQGERLL